MFAAWTDQFGTEVMAAPGAVRVTPWLPSSAGPREDLPAKDRSGKGGQEKAV